MDFTQRVERTLTVRVVGASLLLGAVVGTFAALPYTPAVAAVVGACVFLWALLGYAFTIGDDG